jgi:IclR family pca regulon transcriptional regulator
MNRETDKSFVGSIAKGMDVLSFVVNSPRTAGITRIARDLDLSIGSVQRVTNTLEKLGYLRKDKAAQGYIIGHKAWGLGLAIVKDIDLKVIAHPYLEELSRELGETVNLAIFDGTGSVYVDRIKTEQIININLSIGSRLPVHCTSMGKCLLAYLPDDELAELLDRIEMMPVTPNTITDRGKLLEELRVVRERGFSLNNRELEVGLRSVAAPVRDESRMVIAAVNIAVPSSRVTLEELRGKLAKKVVEVARVISEGMGYRECS